MNKIKLVRIISRLNIGGPSIHVLLLTEGLKQDKFESVLVTGSLAYSEGDMGYLAEKKSVEPKFIMELSREINPWKDLVSFYKIYKLLKKEKPHIVHTHAAKAGALGRIAAFIAGVPVVMHTFHGHVFDGYFSRARTKFFIFMEKILAYLTDVIIVISKRQFNDVVYKYKITKPDKCRIISLGFDLKPFLENNQTEGKLKKELGIPENTNLVGMIGRLAPIKNHKMFIEAIKYLKDRNEVKNDKFLIIGDGELREELEQSTRKEGLKESVIFCGWIRNLEKVYSDLNVVTLTSLNEGTPVSLIEAMASGIPVVATNVGGVGDIVYDGVNGFLVEKNDFKACAEKIKLLLEDRELSLKIGKNGREFVKKLFLKDRLFSDIEETYNEILRKKRVKV